MHDDIIEIRRNTQLSTGEKIQILLQYLEFTNRDKLVKKFKQIEPSISICNGGFTVASSRVSILDKFLDMTLRTIIFQSQLLDTYSSFLTDKYKELLVRMEDI